MGSNPTVTAMETPSERGGFSVSGMRCGEPGVQRCSATCRAQAQDSYGGSSRVVAVTAQMMSVPAV